MFIFESRRYKSLSSITPQPAEPSTDERTGSRLAIQTIQVPLDRQQSNEHVKMSTHSKNIRMKPLSLNRRRQLLEEGDALLPVIRQLNIRDRQVHAVRKERVPLPKPLKKSILKEFASTPFSAWEQHQ